MDLNKSPPISPNNDDDSSSSSSTPQPLHDDSVDSLTHSPWNSARGPWQSPPPSPVNMDQQLVQDPPSPQQLVQDPPPPQQQVQNHPPPPQPPQQLVQDNPPPQPPAPQQQVLQHPPQQNLQDIRIVRIAAEVDTDSSGPDSSVASGPDSSSSGGRNVSPPPLSPSDAESGTPPN